MKKCIIVAATALFFGAFATYAQVKQYDFNLPTFSEIVVGSEFEVTVNRGSDCMATITVEEPYREYVTCEVLGQALNLYLNEKNVPREVKNLYKIKGAPIPIFRAVITAPVNISVISLKDESSLNCKDKLITESFKLSVSDNARLEALAVDCHTASIGMDKRGTGSISIATTSLSVNISGQSSLTITQTSKTLEANLSGFSNFSLFGDSEKLEFNSKGNSKAILNGTVPNANYNLSGTSNIDATNVVCDNAAVNMNGICTLSEAASGSLNIKLSGGATLIYDKTPVISIEEVKTSNIKKYSTVVKK